MANPRSGQLQREGIYEGVMWPLERLRISSLISTLPL